VPARRSSGAEPKRARARATAPRPRPLSGDAVAAALCERVLAGDGVARAEVGLAWGGDDLLRELNRRYRGIDRATDILSFTYEDEFDGSERRTLTGDLVISLPRLLSQAKRYRTSHGRELARLLVHGALHLCGHDHVKVVERRRMRARERVHMNAVDPRAEEALTRLVLGWVAAR
jgi:probable rRNA maturation factor